MLRRKKGAGMKPFSSNTSFRATNGEAGSTGTFGIEPSAERNTDFKLSSSKRCATLKQGSGIKARAFARMVALGMRVSLNCACVTDRVTKKQYQVSVMVTSAQLRAARALLDWTVRELAEQAGVHRNTITRAETDATAHGHAVAQVVLTLEAAGVEFTNGGQPGVRLKAR
jgi:DNA-binding XRE family transcriptional regulator